MGEPEELKTATGLVSPFFGLVAGNKCFSANLPEYCAVELLGPLDGNLTESLEMGCSKESLVLTFNGDLEGRVEARFLSNCSVDSSIALCISREMGKR